MSVAIPLEKISRKEKILAMEALWDDLCRDAEKVLSPEWHGTVLEQCDEVLRIGEAEFCDWNEAKKRIRKECE